MIRTYCEVCHFEANAETHEELSKIWFKHIEKDSHLQNVFMYLMLDTGAETLDELPQKLDEYLENMSKNAN